MNFIIEQAKPQDLQQIINVLKPWNMHHIPSVEVEEIDFKTFYVAKINEQIVGVAGYKILSNILGKTTLLAVYPEFQGSGVGKALQDKRLEVMYQKGIQNVQTNSDRSEIITWYKKHYDYYEIGKVDKLIPFGLENISYWTTLEMNLEKYFENKNKKEQDIVEYINQNDAYPLKAYDPLIINVCLTGMVPTKISTPHVPVFIDEIIEDAINVYDAGARIVHIHARDENGLPTPKAKYYEKIISGIKKERPDMICCATTSGRNWSDFESRSEVLHLTGVAKPDMASLTLGSLNFLSGASINTIDMVERLAMVMKEKNIKPELEVFDSGMVNLAKYLERHGLIHGTKYFNILLGNLNTVPATIENLSHIYNSLPKDSIWAAAGLGQFQLNMNTAAIISGGHVRVGLEDNIYYDHKQTKLATNVDLVKRIVRVSKELQRPIATSTETKRLLNF